MIEQVERFPRIRDHAVFFGDPYDLSAVRVGADLPNARDWAADRFASVGAVSGGVASESAVDRVADRLIELL
ncbi:MAG: hypothetical protein ACRDG7_13675 [Candidatus Limnocylindria bacterium]